MPTNYCTSLDVAQRLSDRGVALRTDDKPNVSEYLRRASNTIRLYCLPLYAESDLQANADADGFINDLATTLSVCYLSKRRGNVPSKAIQEDCDEAMKWLEEIQMDLKQLPDVPQRNLASPAWSNIRVIPGYEYRKIRVEYPISEASTPTGYTQAIDWRSLTFLEY